MSNRRDDGDDQTRRRRRPPPRPRASRRAVPRRERAPVTRRRDGDFVQHQGRRVVGKPFALQDRPQPVRQPEFLRDRGGGDGVGWGDRRTESERSDQGKTRDERSAASTRRRRPSPPPKRPPSRPIGLRLSRNWRHEVLTGRSEQQRRQRPTGSSKLRIDRRQRQPWNEGEQQAEDQQQDGVGDRDALGEPAPARPSPPAAPAAASRHANGTTSPNLIGSDRRRRIATTDSHYRRCESSRDITCGT